MSVRFAVQEAFRSFFRAKALNFITLGAMSMSMLALGLVLVLNLGIFYLVEVMESKVEVVAFIQEQAPEPQLAELMIKVKSHPLVAETEYLSPEDALKEFAADREIQRFVQVLGENPLPASLRIRLKQKNPENVRQFTAWLGQLPGVSDATYGGGDADRLLRTLQFARLVVAVLTASLLFAAVVIVANIIRLMVYARQEEISLLRMIGATAWFIRAPFLIWGVLQGALGGIVASGLLFGLWRILRYSAWVELGVELAGYLPPRAGWIALAAAGGLSAVGAVLGLIGCLVSVGRRREE